MLQFLPQRNIGNMNRKGAKNNLFKHGLNGTFEHRVWQGMTNRCYCKTSGSYKNYGARGITVCDEWRESFLNFLADMGKAPPNTQLDRINNNGNYTKSNCRWVTRKDNCRNRRNSRRLEFNGEIKTLQEWADITKIPRATIERRLDKYGYSVQEALTSPVMTAAEVQKLANEIRWSKNKAKQKEIA